MMPGIAIGDFVAAFPGTLFERWAGASPWELTRQSEAVVRALVAALPAHEYVLVGEAAIHRSAVIETGAVLKGALVIGPGSFVASAAYLRGGNWIGERCTIGPGCELKSSFLFAGSALAHFNFVGDSILGSGVNLEAGAVICNTRNERADKAVVVRVSGQTLHTGVEKFGALVGDRSRLGANCVIAPGAVLAPQTIVGRTALLDPEAAALR